MSEGGVLTQALQAALTAFDASLGASINVARETSRITPAMFKTDENTWAQAFNAAAACLCQKGGGVLDMEGRAYTFTAPLVVDGSDISIDAAGARINFDHNAGPCVTFGNGATQKARMAVRGGLWIQTLQCVQPLFAIRGVRGFLTDDIKTSQLYSYVLWGKAGDAVASYIWHEGNEEINLRTATFNGSAWVNGHGHGIVIEKSAGAWYQTNVQLEAANAPQNHNFATTAGIYFPPNFDCARFDHWMVGSCFVKGFSRNVYINRARVVNLQLGNLRLDDSVLTAFHVVADTVNSGIESGSITLDIQGTSTGSGVVLACTANAPIGNIAWRVTSTALTAEVFLVTASAGTVQDMSITVHAADWHPSSQVDAIQFVQSGGGVITFITFPSISVRSTVAQPGNSPLTKYGTTTLFKYGVVNCLNFVSPTPNF